MMRSASAAIDARKLCWNVSAVSNWTINISNEKDLEAAAELLVHRLRHV